MTAIELDPDDLDRANAERVRRGDAVLTWAQAESALDYWQPRLLSLHWFLVRLIPHSKFAEKGN